MLQGREGEYKLGVVGSTIYVLLQIFSRMLLSKIMKIGSRIKSYCKNKKGVVFLKHSVLSDLMFTVVMLQYVVHIEVSVRYRY